ncbi:hypothetical protein P9H08_17090 [Bacillus cereus]|nr:hypothetical protein [Bacillus cereus]
MIEDFAINTNKERTTLQRLAAAFLSYNYYRILTAALDYTHITAAGVCRAISSWHM